MNDLNTKLASEREQHKGQRLVELIKRCKNYYSGITAFNPSGCTSQAMGQVAAEMVRYDRKQNQKRQALQQQHQQEQAELQQRQQTTRQALKDKHETEYAAFQAQQRKRHKFLKDQKLLELFLECQNREVLIIYPDQCVEEAERRLIGAMVPIDTQMAKAERDKRQEQLDKQDQLKRQQQQAQQALNAKHRAESVYHICIALQPDTSITLFALNN